MEIWKIFGKLGKIGHLKKNWKFGKILEIRKKFGKSKKTGKHLGKNWKFGKRYWKFDKIWKFGKNLEIWKTLI